MESFDRVSSCLGFMHKLIVYIQLQGDQEAYTDDVYFSASHNYVQLQN